MPYMKAIMTAITTDASYADYLQAYKALHPIRQNILRAVAITMLQSSGASEIGTSDVSAQVFSIFKQHGHFEADLITELRDEWLSWAAIEGER